MGESNPALCGAPRQERSVSAIHYKELKSSLAFTYVDGGKGKETRVDMFRKRELEGELRAK